MSDWPTRQTRATNIVLLGREQIPKYNSPEFISVCEKMGMNPEQTRLLLPPSDSTEDGFQEIIEFSCFAYQADGVLLNRRNQSVIVPTRDCLTIVLEDLLANVVVIHAGRSSLWHNGSLSGCVGCCVTSVVQNAMTALMKNNPGHNPQEVSVHIIDGISAEHFKHDHPDALEKVKHYSLLGKDEVFLDYEQGQLDLVAAAKVVMARLGISEMNITNENHCTFKSEHLASKRALDAGIAGNEGHNLTGVTRVR
ncbi:laccase domain-containing protein [Candidatus Kaiserbacteria bacterium]|nr:laccase domain-containing protein [Candidatus Kaiserbacteria bacterium]